MGRRPMATRMCAPFRFSGEGRVVNVGGMQWKKIRYRLEWVGVKALTGVIPLLPRRVVAGASSPAPNSGTPAPHRPALLTYLILYGVFTLFMLAIQWMVGVSHGPGAINSAPALPASSISSQSSSPKTNQ